ncbi:lipid II:glycine glycyltransferase FemX [Inconstantimicrobium mannanitabidum]|uniref:Uncharacterized protein n=1 Tax=Inconstantimicrobium mannanitabidum TaxID=1604901 RepID=A0ACB5R8M0_9CLOT|nr:GNAT family N-acetyltransferase [Clostridium sp. TW13]GKX65527.1 hypothetical protein rsdtw13_07850 [Clostridium sp. TW13]
MYVVLDASSKDWNKYLYDINIDFQDIYYTSDYYKLYEKNGDGKGKLFVYRESNNIAIYPFMLNEIENNNFESKYYDIESAYGYGGPLTNSYNKKFLSNFEDEFLKYCNENGIVAEFIRFHPLIKNEKIFNENIEVLHNRITVYLDLTRDVDVIWKEEIKSKNRNMIRKAEKSGLTVEESKDFQCFKNIYEATMKKVTADSYYYFKNDYYDFMENSDNYIILNVKKENQIIASAVFMIYGQYFHYHLSGSLKEYLNYSPNNLLLWEAIKYAKAKGCRIMHFGGGLTNSVDDNLFKFKKSFSNELADFYIGKRVHNKKVYDSLIEEWERKNNKKATMLLQYKVCK